jgi:hypothetical protein
MAVQAECRHKGLRLWLSAAPSTRCPGRAHDMGRRALDAAPGGRSRVRSRHTRSTLPALPFCLAAIFSERTQSMRCDSALLSSQIACVHTYRRTACHREILPTLIDCCMLSGAAINSCCTLTIQEKKTDRSSMQTYLVRVSIREH